MAKPWGALPVARILTIMKSSSEVEAIAKDSTLIMTKATDLFIRKLADESYKVRVGEKKIDYKDVAQVVHNYDKYEFLWELIPKKITYGEYKKIMTRKQTREMNKKEAETSSESEDFDSDDSISSNTNCSQ